MHSGHGFDFFQLRQHSFNLGFNHTTNLIRRSSKNSNTESWIGPHQERGSTKTRSTLWKIKATEAFPSVLGIGQASPQRRDTCLKHDHTWAQASLCLPCSFVPRPVSSGFPPLFPWKTRTLRRAPLRLLRFGTQPPFATALSYEDPSPQKEAR